MTEEEFKNGTTSEEGGENGKSETVEGGATEENPELEGAGQAGVAAPETGSGELTGGTSPTLHELSLELTSPKPSLVFVGAVTVYRSQEDGSLLIVYDEDKKEAQGAHNGSAVGILASQYLSEKAQASLQVTVNPAPGDGLPLDDETKTA